MQHQVPSAAPCGSEASCAATQPDFPGSTSGCHQLPVPCSVPAEPQQQPRKTLPQKKPEAGGEPAFGASQLCWRDASPPSQHPPHLWAATASSSCLTAVRWAVPGCRMTLASRGAGTCRARCPAAERSSCSIASSHLLLQSSSQSSRGDVCPDPRDRRARQRPATRSY